MLSRPVLRLALGGVLLMGSAGLAVAASLLFYSATYEGNVVQVAWEINTETDVTGFDLSRQAGPTAPFTLVASIVPTGQRRYQLADSLAASYPPPDALTYRLVVHGAGPDQTYTTAAAAPGFTMQRSWHTIKLVFR